VAYYVSPFELRAAVIASQEVGHVTPELYKFICLIASHYLTRCNLPHSLEWEDLTSAVVYKVARTLPAIDPDRLLFSYVTTILVNEIRQQMRQENKRERIRRRARAILLERIRENEKARAT
jgi:DNA-directed RNA polymerase specialized sigma24 family protein